MICEDCGSLLPDGRPRFCSRTCSRRAWRRDNADRIRAQDRTRYAADPKKAMERTLNWRERHPAAARAAARRSRLKKKYGLSVEAVDAVVADGACPICRRSFEVVQPRVDHDHVTGEVRGVICNDCNLGLGLFGDDWERLFCALQYLRGRRTNRDALVREG